jgi:DNA-binding CsgD family transcriptional regulator
MLVVVLTVAFVFCLGVAAGALLLARQLVTTYNSAAHKHFFYYLAAFYAFAFYGIWGQILARGLLSLLATEGEVVEAVAAFLPVLGVPFLFVSWIMLVQIGHALARRAQHRLWLLWHVAAFALLLAGSWLTLTALGTPAEPSDATFSVVEAVAMSSVELLYFAVFLALVLRIQTTEEARKVLLRFALLLFGSFVARSLFGGLVLLDARLGVPALLVYFGSNLVPLFYLRAVSDAAFKPVKTQTATPKGIDHVLTLHGVTKRERQVVEQICLGKTNKQIADELFISLQTVKDHTHRIYSKLGVKSRMQLVQAMDAAK